jgi:hypothetical protein
VKAGLDLRAGVAPLPRTTGRVAGRVGVVRVGPKACFREVARLASTTRSTSAPTAELCSSHNWRKPTGGRNSGPAPFLSPRWSSPGAKLETPAFTNTRSSQLPTRESSRSCFRCRSDQSSCRRRAARSATKQERSDRRCALLRFVRCRSLKSAGRDARVREDAVASAADCHPVTGCRLACASERLGTRSTRPLVLLILESRQSALQQGATIRTASLITPNGTNPALWAATGAASVRMRAFVPRQQ